MKDKFIKLLLGLVQFSIDMGIITAVFAAFAIVLGGICCLIAPKTLLDQPLTGSLVIQGIVAAILAVLYFFGLLAAHQLLDNLNRARYFVAANCQALKRILYLAVAGTVISGLATIWLHLAHTKPLFSFIVTSHGDFDYNLTFIILLLIIYLIFQRGLALQDDANSII